MGKICPMMSEIIRSRFKGVTENTDGNEDLCKVKCLGKDCALWIIEMGDSKIPIERCGLIK